MLYQSGHFYLLYSLLLFIIAAVRAIIINGSIHHFTRVSMLLSFQLICVPDALVPISPNKI